MTATTSRASMVETQSDVDLHQLLVPTPPHDGPPRALSSAASSGPSSDAGSFVIPDSLSRSNSAFSFSRASFSSQLASLTAINTPQAESLAATVTTLATARKAVKAVTMAAEQIQGWIKKALKVLENLDADDDVEWAAAAGRLGLDETERTIGKFEKLITVYVLSIEALQARPDIADAKADELQGVVEQMEVTLEGWDHVRRDLKKIHEQVELAMEWEELWAKVLGDVGAELDSLSQLVFEMEEKRHTAYEAHTQPGKPATIDLNELESFVDEPSHRNAMANPRFSLTFEPSPLESPAENPQNEANLLALFARMQPLRASLDFLPMRLSMFQSRAERVFPMACKELDDKCARLEKNWTELSREAETLRRELSEDRWVMVFRNAGRQAQKMCESVERSILKVQEGIHENLQALQPGTLSKRIESFEAKKMHYGTAIRRVLAIIQKGLKDRLTVNGEILRLHKDLSARMRDLSDAMDDVESLLEPLHTRHNATLRESISSIMSADRSFTSTTFAETPGSSPPSSVDFPARWPDKTAPRYGLNGHAHAPPRTPSSSRPPPASASRRSSILPLPRRPMTPLLQAGAGPLRRGASPLPGPPSIYRQGLYAPAVAPTPPRPPPTPLTSKPRWSSVVKPSDHAATRASTATPLTVRKYTPRSISSSAALTLPHPRMRESTASPTLAASALGRRESLPFRSYAERAGNPAAARPGGGLLDPVPYHRGRRASAAVAGTIRSPSSLAVHHQRKPTMSGIGVARPPSSLSRSQEYVPTGVIRLVGSGPRQENQHRHHDGADADDREPDGPEVDRSGADEEDDVVTEPTSSPLSKRVSLRPGSVLAMSSRVRRVSMLPVPVGTGRQSSLGMR